MYRAVLFMYRRRHGGKLSTALGIPSLLMSSFPPSTPAPSGDAVSPSSAAATLQLRAFRQQAKAELRAALTQLQHRGISYAAKW